MDDSARWSEPEPSVDQREFRGYEAKIVSRTLGFQNDGYDLGVLKQLPQKQIQLSNGPRCQNIPGIKLREDAHQSGDLRFE